VREQQLLPGLRDRPRVVAQGPRPVLDLLQAGALANGGVEKVDSFYYP